ncbi:MAG: nucleoside hydrolase [Candidatus Bathyarchaeota archaeon]|nr:MAG: nucleoside hydrolase [Candidatus Bathyarchaeota archaeon]
MGDELTIVPLGPLTNIAAAIMAKPSIIGEVSGFVLMGGAYNLTPYGHGNVTPVAEFNVWHDPEAAKIVFESGIPIKAVGLDVTTDPANRLSTGRFAEIEALGTERAELIASLCRNLVERLGGLSLHDPLTLASVVNPGLVETVPVRVEVETRGEVTLGMTVVDRRQRHRVSGVEANVDTCISVDSKRFLGMFFERVVHGRV